MHPQQINHMNELKEGVQGTFGQAVDAFIGEVTQKVTEGNSVVLKD